jgi:hypothetical protein
MRYWELLLTRASLYWTAIRWFAAVVLLYYGVRLIAVALAAGVTDDLAVDGATVLLLALLVVSRSPKEVP